jgi:hypothetical protein
VNTEDKGKKKVKLFTSDPGSNPYSKAVQDYNKAQDYGLYGNVSTKEGEFKTNPLGSTNKDYELNANQSVADMLGNTLFQIGADIVAGVPNSVGSLLGIAERVTQSESVFKNFFLDLADDIKTYSQEEFPIYLRDPNASFDWGSGAWWAQGSVSAIGSSLSLMFPAMGLSKVGLKNINRLIQLSKPTSKVRNLLKYDNVTQGVLMGGLMRNTENFMEGYQVRKTFLQNEGLTITDPNNPNYLSETEFKQLKETNGISADRSREDVAQILADKAAARSYSVNSINYITDIAQSVLLLGMLKGNPGAGRINKAFSRPSLKSTVAQAESIGKPMTRLNRWVYRGGTGLHTIATQGLSEGVEELINHIGTEEGLHYGKTLVNQDDGSTFGERFNEYIKDPKAWEAAFWGAIGGTFTPGVIEKFGQAKDYALGKPNVDEQQAEILARKVTISLSQGLINQVDNNINPLTGEAFEGSEESIERQKSDVKNSIFANLSAKLGVSAARVNNEKRLTKFFDSGEVQAELAQIGIKPETVEKLKEDSLKHAQRYLDTKRNLNKNDSPLSKAYINDIISNQIVESEVMDSHYESLRKEAETTFNEVTEKDVYQQSLEGESKAAYNAQIEHIAKRSLAKELQKVVKDLPTDTILDKVYKRNMEAKIEELQNDVKEIEETYNLNEHVYVNREVVQKAAELENYKTLKELHKKQRQGIFDNIDEYSQEIETDLKENAKKTTKEAIQKAKEDLSKATTAEEVETLQEQFNKKFPNLKSKVGYESKLQELKDAEEAKANAVVNPENVDELEQDNEITKVDEVVEVDENGINNVLEEAAAEAGIDLSDLRGMLVNPELRQGYTREDDEQDNPASFSDIQINTTDQLTKIESVLLALSKKQSTPEIEALKERLIATKKQILNNRQVNNPQKKRSNESVTVSITPLYAINKNRDSEGYVVLKNAQQAETLVTITEGLKNGDEVVIKFADNENDFASRSSFQRFGNIEDLDNRPVVVKTKSGVVLGYINTIAKLNQLNALSGDLLNLHSEELLELEQLINESFIAGDAKSYENVINSPVFNKINYNSDVSTKFKTISNLLMFGKVRNKEYTKDVSVTRKSIRSWQTNLARDFSNTKRIREQLKNLNGKPATVKIDRITTGQVVINRKNKKGKFLKEVISTSSKDVKLGFVDRNDNTRLHTPAGVVLNSRPLKYDKQFYILLKDRSGYVPEGLFRVGLGQLKDKTIHKFLANNVFKTLKLLEENVPYSDERFINLYDDFKKVVSTNSNPKNGPLKGEYKNGVFIYGNKNTKYELFIYQGELTLSITDNKTGKTSSTTQKNRILESFNTFYRKTDYAAVRENKPFFDPVTKTTYDSYSQYLIESDAFTTMLTGVKYNDTFISHFTNSQDYNAHSSNLVLEISNQLNTDTDVDTDTDTNTNTDTDVNTDTGNDIDENDVSSIGGLDLYNEVFTALSNSKYNFLNTLLISGLVRVHPNIITKDRIPDGNVNAFAFAKGDTMYITENFKNLDKREQLSKYVHEIVHNVLNNFKYTRPQQYAEYKKKLNLYVKSLDKYIKDNDISVPAKIKQVLQAARQNPEEIVTYGFTTPEVAKFLDSLVISNEKAKESKTLFGKLKDIIREALQNLGVTTKLDELNSLLDDVFYYAEPTAKKQTKPTTETKTTQRDRTGENQKGNTENNGRIKYKDIDVDDEFGFSDIDFPSNWEFNRNNTRKVPLRKQIRDTLLSRGYINKYNEFWIKDKNGNSNLNKIYEVAESLVIDARWAGFDVTVEDVFELSTEDRYMNENGKKGKLIFNKTIEDVQFSDISINNLEKGLNLYKKCN